MSSGTIKFLGWILVELVAVYLFSWFGLYSMFLEGDYSHFWAYFVLSWSGGGEIPALIQAFAIVLAGGFIILRNMERLLRKYYRRWL